MKLKSNAVLSKHLQYHITKNIPITENIFRYGSKAWSDLICEVRKLYNNGLVIELDEHEYAMIESDMGEPAMFEGKEIYLEAPEKLWSDDNELAIGYVVYVRCVNQIERIEFEDTFGPL